METVLEECATEEQRPVLRFLWAKGLNAKDIHKEMFPVYGGKCFFRKAIHNCSEKFTQGRSKVADEARSGSEVAETTVKRLLCCGFRRTGKAMGQMNQCWWRICREIDVFSRFEYHMFYILYPFVTLLLTLPVLSRDTVALPLFPQSLMGNCWHFFFKFGHCCNHLFHFLVLKYRNPS
jgi:hypothetical protein